MYNPLNLVYVCPVRADEKIAFTTIHIELVKFVCSAIVLMNLDVIR